VLHIDDLCDLVLLQINRLDEFNGEIFNVGGGQNNSASLQEMTVLCREITGATIPIKTDPQTRSNDLIWYITDNSKVSRSFGWEPRRTIKDTITDINQWLCSNRDILYTIL